MKTRHKVLSGLFLLSVITYLDRVCVSVAGVRIKQDLGLTNEQFGWVLSVFSLAYGLFEIPTGALGDRLGPRRVLTRVVLWWSAFTAATGLAFNYISLLVTRFLFGIGEAGAYPNASIAVARWFPLREKARAQSVIWMASRVGGALSPLLIVPLQSAFGWRATFFVFALLGVGWAWGWHRWFRDEPAQVRGIAADELAHIQASRLQRTAHGPFPWRAMLTSGRLWLLMVMYHFYLYGAYFYLSWMPTYLQEGLGFSEKQMAFWAMLPFLLGAGGCLAGGALSDWLVGRVGLKWGRRGVSVVGLGLSAFCILLAATLNRQPTVAATFLALGLACKDFTLPVAWAASMDMGRGAAGAVSGAMNMAGQFGSAVVAVLFGYLVTATGSYHLPVMGIAACLGVSATCWLFIDPTQPILPEPVPASAEPNPVS